MFGARFFEQLWRGVIFESDVHNYSLLHYPASIRETDRHDSLLDGRADGILLHDHLNARTVYLLSAGMPTVVLTRSVNLPEGCGAAYADDILSATIALDYLWDLGHRRIAHIAGPVGDLAVGVTRPLVVHPLWEDDVAIQRLNGYVGYMQAHGAYDPALIVYSQSWTSNRAIETVQAWLGMENPPTAVFCANDQQALGIIEAAHVLGVKIPDGLSVVGVDDTQNAKDMNPRLTSVAVPMEEIGRAGVVALLNLMEGKPMEQCRLQVPVSHISIRESAIAVGGHSRLSDRTRY
jgi:LacI family transcriptional regulator